MTDRQVEELRESRRRLVLAADADRRRFERELHDGLQQDLVAILVKLQLVRRLVEDDTAAAAALLDEIRGDAQATLDATRALALRLSPPLLDAAGMKAALKATAPETTVEIALGENCPGEIAACVYFCCLELLPDASAIGVRDEGDSVAFDVVLTGESPALGRVRDRTEALGGQLAAEGARVSGRLPLR